jgi:hypothetical protein
MVIGTESLSTWGAACILSQLEYPVKEVTAPEFWVFCGLDKIRIWLPLTLLSQSALEPVFMPTVTVRLDCFVSQCRKLATMQFLSHVSKMLQLLKGQFITNERKYCSYTNIRKLRQSSSCNPNFWVCLPQPLCLFLLADPIVSFSLITLFDFLMTHSQEAILFCFKLIHHSCQTTILC